MSKTKRELLMLAGILVLLGGIFFVRMGGGEQSSSPSTVSPGSQTQTAPQPGGTAPGTMTPGDQPGLLSQSALAFFEPGLTDSAVTARIFSSTVGDPFASIRGVQTRPARQVTRPQQQPITQPVRRVQYLDDWPAQITYQGHFPVAGSPGVYRVSFNGRIVEVGEKIASTEYILVEASALLVQIRWEDQLSNTVWIFRYIRQQPVPDLR